MRNRYLLGAGVALAVAFGGAQAQAQVMGQSFLDPIRQAPSTWDLKVGGPS